MNSTTILKIAGAALLLLPPNLSAASAGLAEGRVAVTGGSLFYRGFGSGTPVVLLHGYSNSSSVWEPFLDALAGSHRVIAFDLPGHGGSEQLNRTFSHAGAAASLLEAVDALGLESFHVVGHSSGGLIALQMALLQPGRLLSITTIATPWRVPDSLRDAGKRLSVETAPPPMIEALQGWHPGGLEQIRWLLEQQRRMAADPSEMALADEQLQRVTSPTLVVHGDRDDLLPVSTAVDLASRLPRAWLLVLPGLRHELGAHADLASRLLVVAVSEFLRDQTPNPSLQRTPPVQP